ncbi:uncharacterized protein FJT64_020198 [Amphibalanus amphitrite]|uniref:RNA-directed DNA polymerase n=1 Tax=Amphibalanus amphitrite TaxID=1232801 RepID=A0A6A4WTK6_AMPAM|nr:uncharacterized protein FJT64_020198 [Amphibalanus amphitrite]
MSGDSGPPLPAPFLPHPGTPAVPWRNWEQKFELYLLARCGTSPLPPEQRRALLLCAIGDEAYRVFDTLPPVAKRDGEDDYDVTLRQLREFYTPRTNVIVERFRFRQRAQAPTESTADFVAALRGLARTCQFGAMESELIRDVVVEKTPHQRLRERLLQDRDLTLDKVLSVTAGDVTQEVPLQVDTGATCSLLSVNRAKELFRGVAYSPSSSRLYGFGQQPLPVLGMLPTTVTYNNQAVPTNFYLVDTNKTEAIMGMDLLQALGYLPGRSIPVADALSRLPLPDTGAAETDGDEIVALLTDDVSDVITDDDVCAASAADPVMEQLRSVIRTGWPAAARQCTPETRDYFAVRNELQVRQDGVVLRGPDRAVVPAALRSKYLQLAHRAHDGVVRTKQLLRDLAWWPGMSKDAAALVADCPSCHAKDAVLTQQARPAPLQPVELPDRPWSKLGLDIVGPIPGAPPSANFSGHVRQRLALYRATPHCTTGQSPSALLHGRRMRLHLPVTTETPPRDSSLQHRVATQQQRNSRGYDSRQATRPSDLQPGDTVRVRRQGHVPKNQSPVGGTPRRELPASSRGRRRFLPRRFT